MSGDDPLAPLRTKFLERARVDGEALIVALDAEDIARVEALAHGLAGSAGMLGFSDIGQAALAIDALFAEGQQPPRTLVETLAATIRRYS